jgi:ornithine--oxo-acid transaminase
MGETAEFLTKTLGFDAMLPMNTGAEACETGVKLARRWGYAKKGIPNNKAVVLVAKGCFWGRTITASGACDDPQRYHQFGPFTPGFKIVNYNDVENIRENLEKNG